MADAWLRHQSASPTSWERSTGALHSVAARSKCTAAFLSSAAERGPAFQATRPLSTSARMRLANLLFGVALKAFADNALSSSSFHHSGCVQIQFYIALPQGHSPAMLG